ncbi:MAG: hypothetical protein AAF703_11890 [Cyanobacteria bacterium P01_D01_bin.105]
MLIQVAFATVAFQLVLGHQLKHWLPKSMAKRIRKVPVHWCGHNKGVVETGV